MTHEQNVWRFTGFYGNPNSSSRIFSWKLLGRLNSIPELQHLPWLIGGDFNEILYESEKSGGSLRSMSQISAFRDVINSCMLSDLNSLVINSLAAIGGRLVRLFLKDWIVSFVTLNGS